MATSSADLQQLTHDQLVNLVQDLQTENNALSRQLRSSVSRGSQSHVDPTSGGGSSTSMGPLSPAAARLSAQRNSTLNYTPPTALPKKRTYDISMSVMVIENGSALSLPMSAVLDKTYGREDMRDADTPVVSSKFLAAEGSLGRSQRFSIGSGEFNSNSFRQEESFPSANLDEEFESLAGGARASINGPLNLAEEEPNPRDPNGAAASAGGASTLAQRARVNPLDFKNGLLFRDMSLEADALISLQTLRFFNQQYGRDCLSPVSSYGNSVYHYIVKTFAVRNGCAHSPEDVEGFGRTLVSLCREVRQVLTSQPRHASVAAPCYVFGDLHGNFRDLFYFMDNLISFQDLRYTPHRFLFLGDYVDRGEFSVEVLAYLFAMKVIAPDKVFLLRGNHEDTLVNGDIGGYGSTSFRAQCHTTFGAALGEELWRKANETFSYLPLSANIDNKIFCVHGGIPRYRGGVDNRLQILKDEEFPAMESFFQVPEGESPRHSEYRQVGMDTCWADPAENESTLDSFGFGNNPRGTGVILFGSAAVDDFLNRHGYEYIFRAHQEKSDGLKLSKNARVFTIFSTSAYVGHQNGAGVVLVADGKIRLIVKNADTYEDEEYEEE